MIHLKILSNNNIFVLRFNFKHINIFQSIDQNLQQL